MSRCPKCGAIDVSEQAHQTRYGCGTVTTPENGVVLVGHACLERQLAASEARAKRLREVLEPFAAVGRIVRDEDETVFDAMEEKDIRKYPMVWVSAAEALAAKEAGA